MRRGREIPHRQRQQFLRLVAGDLPRAAGGRDVVRLVVRQHECDVSTTTFSRARASTRRRFGAPRRAGPQLRGVSRVARGDGGLAKLARGASLEGRLTACRISSGMTGLSRIVEKPRSTRLIEHRAASGCTRHADDLRTFRVARAKGVGHVKPVSVRQPPIGDDDARRRCGRGVRWRRGRCRHARRGIRPTRA